MSSCSVSFRSMHALMLLDIWQEGCHVWSMKILWVAEPIHHKWLALSAAWYVDTRHRLICGDDDWSLWHI